MIMIGSISLRGRAASDRAPPLAAGRKKPHHNAVVFALDLPPEESVHGHMDRDHQDLLRGLFAAATVALEDANDVAVEGQAVLQDAAAYWTLAKRLRDAAGPISVLADAGVRVPVWSPFSGAIMDQIRAAPSD